jgi:hypothetical protein
MRGVQIWRSGSVQSPVEEVTAPAVSCLCDEALFEWLFGEIVSSQATMAAAILLAKELNDMHGLALALHYSAMLGYCESNPGEVERLASDLIELSTRQNFPDWLAAGTVLRGWAHSASGDTAEGLSWIEDGIVDWRATGSKLLVPYWLALKAEALHLAGRTGEALEAIREADQLVETSEARWWCAELQRLRGVFLAAVGADDSPIEASFCAVEAHRKAGRLEMRPSYRSDPLNPLQISRSTTSSWRSVQISGSAATGFSRASAPT